MCTTSRLQKPIGDDWKAGSSFVSRKALVTGAVLLLGIACVGLASRYPAHDPLKLSTTKTSVRKRSRLQEDVMETFKATLPDYSISSLEEPDSPQSDAFQWLSNHPNISTMEDWRKTQLFALSCIYFSLDGPNWTREPVWGPGQLSWLNYSTPECLWDQRWSSVCDSDDHMLALNLDYIKINDTFSLPRMPAEIGLMSSLRRVSYNMDTKITIDELLPPQHFSLPDLEFISLSSLGGTLLPEIGGLAASLKSLSIHHNYLLDPSGTMPAAYGPLPTELGLLTTMTVPTLNNAAFQGSLTSELGMMTNLGRLVIAGTDLAGQVPSEIALLTSLTKLSLVGNANLGGNLPLALGSLSALREVDIRGNNVAGPIPIGLVSQSSLRMLDLSGNRLSGAIPTEVGLSTSLSRVEFQGNQLIGPIPSEIAMLNRLRTLDLSSNNIDGTLPTEIASMTIVLEHLNLSYNGINGTLPSAIGALRVKRLDLSHNAFNGQLPTEIGQVNEGTRGRYSSWELDLSYNSFNFQLPSEIGMLTSMTSLKADHNDLVGPIPTELGALVFVNRLDLSFNSFSLSIPSQMGLMTSLVDLDLSDLPNLTGQIPTELGDLVFYHDLHNFNVSGDPLLGGELPEGLCELNVNQTYCVYRDTCKFSFDCSAQLCGCGNCFCTNVNIARRGNDFDFP